MDCYRAKVMDPNVIHVKSIYNYSLLSIPRISRDWAKYVELSVVRGNQIMTHYFGAK